MNDSRARINVILNKPLPLNRGALEAFFQAYDRVRAACPEISKRMSRDTAAMHRYWAVNSQLPPHELTDDLFEDPTLKDLLLVQSAQAYVNDLPSRLNRQENGRRILPTAKEAREIRNDINEMLGELRDPETLKERLSTNSVDPENMVQLMIIEKLERACRSLPNLLRILKELKPKEEASSRAPIPRKTIQELYDVLSANKKGLEQRLAQKSQAHKAAPATNAELLHIAPIAKRIAMSVKLAQMSYPEELQGSDSTIFYKNMFDHINDDGKAPEFDLMTDDVKLKVIKAIEDVPFNSFHFDLEKTITEQLLGELPMAGKDIQRAAHVIDMVQQAGEDKLILAEHATQGLEKIAQELGIDLTRGVGRGGPK